ncbi:MAG: biotin--[acetyl-CoA-carboxylase] ligase [Rickettsiales bacterium]|nr:biotin--[acetyl-CoA-carboxylase] ligase [Rickettsiales bacterium]
MNEIKKNPTNTIIIAQTQTMGKGKANRVWKSENNGNLYFSMSINADANLDYSQISFIVSIALRSNIVNSISKWPNDILLNDKKCCGLILEKDKNNLIIGIGVNINEYPQDTNFLATSLKNEGIIVEKYSLLRGFLDSFNYYLNVWLEQGFLPIREEWLKRCYKFGGEIKVNDRVGIFNGFDKDGTLLFKCNNKIEYIKSGDVF